MTSKCTGCSTTTSHLGARSGARTPVLQAARQHGLCLPFALSIACSSSIKADIDPTDSAATTEHTGTHTEDTADSDSGEDTSAPPTTGSVEVAYTVSLEFGDTSIEVCTGTAQAENVDTSWRTWSLWADAGLDIDPENLPTPAPSNTPVGDGVTVNPGSWRFSYDATSDTDFAAFATRIGQGDPVACLLAQGAAFDLVDVQVNAEPGLPDAVVSAVVMRISVLWTDTP